MSERKKKDSEKNSIEAIIRNEIMAFFKKYDGKPLNYKQITKRLGLNGEEQKKRILQIVTLLKKQNQLKEIQPGKYLIHPGQVKKTDFIPATHIIGTLEMTSTGKGFVISDQLEEDIKISPANLNQALNGDKVKVNLFAKRKDRRLEGEIIEILERAKTMVVGIIEKTAKFAFVIPDDPNFGAHIFIPLTHVKNAKDGQKVIARITDWPKKAKNPIGEITKVLGNPGEHQVEMESILFDYELPIEFPENVVKAANKIPLELPKDEIARRRDFRNILTFTIDPFDAKDFDDALSIQILPNGNWEIGVHIADVSHYVQPNSILDNEALERGTSVYLVDRVIPMLPEHLSNGVCSLRPNEDKFCFSAVFEMDEEANIKTEWFGKTVINSNRRFTYEEVQTIIENKEGEYSKELLLLNKLAKQLRENRTKAGAFEFNKIEVKFELDDKGTPINVFFKIQKDAHKLIEDFMLLANRKVAEHIGLPKKTQKYYPLVYRVHDAPDPEKLTEFARFVTKLGYQIQTQTRKSTVDTINRLLLDVKGRGEQNLIENLAVRAMAKAQYTTKNIGHYGLSFNYYTHFTSPIRRYPDLMVHRLLSNFLNHENPYIKEEELETVSLHSSKKEVNAAEAERASIKYKQVEFLKDKIGETFDGLISGVTKWGIYVELSENKCEGMIRLNDIDDDFYIFDEDNYQIVGHRYGNCFRLGDKVRIKVKRADLLKKQLDFELITSD